jgi:ADP-ribose pyrophosphatase
MPKKLKVLKSVTELENPWFKVIMEKVVNPINKHQYEFHTLVRNKAIFIIPFENKNIYLIKQYRHSVKKNVLELPAGCIENNYESPIDSARRELKEETGFEAKNITKIGHFYIAPGHSSQEAEVYLATHLKKSEKSPEQTEIISKMEKISLPKLKRLINKNQILSGPTLSSLCLFLNSKLHKCRIF